MTKTSLAANLIAQAESALRECFSQLPDSRVAIEPLPRLPIDRPPQVDLIATVTLSEEKHSLIVETKLNGEPALARQAIYQLKYGQNLIGDVTPIFIAPYISPQTARLCRDENVGYLDMAGNCHIELAGVYVHVEGKANPFARTRKLNSLYQPKAERVLRVLLTCHPRSWRIQELADEARVSIGQVYKVKQLLLEKEWQTDAKDGISLTKPAELLSDWRVNYRFNKHRKVTCYTLSDLATFEKELSSLCRQTYIPCGFTSLAAASRYAPYATYLQTTAYVESEDFTKFQGSLELEPVDSGANVIMLTPYDDGVFYGNREEQEVSFVSPIQTYLDLKGAGGRADEAAEHLLNTAILPKW